MIRKILISYILIFKKIPKKIGNKNLVNTYMANSNFTTHIHDIPDTIMSSIFSLITCIRTRNGMSLVCHRWYKMERSTRTTLTLRGNVRDLFLIPMCFRAVSKLDLSHVSPWGHPLLDASQDADLLAQLLHRAFPSVVSLTIYLRSPSTLHHLAPRWPNLQNANLIRWHKRSLNPLGSDLLQLFQHCHSLSSLDISKFYCWNEDVLAALGSYPNVGASLSHLNILSHTSCEGFKAHELLTITKACPNLQEFLTGCVFNPMIQGFVGDETLLSLASNCPRLSLLHLINFASLMDLRIDLNEDGYTTQDAKISQSNLAIFFARLPLLEELVLDICYNIRDSDHALEQLGSSCPGLRSLRLGQFHGIYQGFNLELEGIAICKGLKSLSIKNSVDLTDSSLIAILHGCSKLESFELQGCKRVTEIGIREMASALSNSLVEVKISSCKYLNAFRIIRALEPIKDKLEKLHIDCVWGSSVLSVIDNRANSSKNKPLLKDLRPHKKPKYDLAIIDESTPISKTENGNGHLSLCPNHKAWRKLKYLSLWIAVNETLDPLLSIGLEACPVLEELRIKVEGDCRQFSKPSIESFGLGSLLNYPKLSRMHFDCGNVIGYTLTAPFGRIDLSLWERYFLIGVERLNLNELNYWPPQDTEINRRSMSLPAAGLLAQCLSLRKLFIHGTANEHLTMFLLNIPSLRDVQLREDYYPAPEDETCTELRKESCRRFEDALRRRQIPD